MVWKSCSWSLLPVGEHELSAFLTCEAKSVLHRRIDAVCNAIELPWSKGEGEGQINRLKTTNVRCMAEQARSSSEHACYRSSIVITKGFNAGSPENE